MLPAFNNLLSFSGSVSARDYAAAEGDQRLLFDRRLKLFLRVIVSTFFATSLSKIFDVDGANLFLSSDITTILICLAQPDFLEFVFLRYVAKE